MIFTAIGAAIFGAGTFLAAATAATLEVAAGVAVNLIAKSLMGKDTQSSAPLGVQGTLSAGDDVPRSFPLGYSLTEGSLVYANEWGTDGDTPNAYHTQVICISDLPLPAGADGLVGLYVGGNLCTVDWTTTDAAGRGNPVTEYIENGANYLWVKFYDGTQTAADSFLTGTVSSTERPWQSTRVGTGCAYAIVTARLNSNLFSGFPSCKFAVGPVPLYDPSRDTSVGGDGPQRQDDPTTWGGDGDTFPAVQLYNIARGITYNDTWLYGLQNLNAARVPAADWIAAINKCRATIEGADGLEATYRAGGYVAVNTPIADTATALLTACQGRLAETGGVYKMFLGAPDDPAWSITDDVIISTEQQSFTPFFDLADSYNGITASYPDPANAWNTTTAPPLYNSNFEADDGNRRLVKDVALDFVPYAGQVQRLMKAALAEARRQRQHTIVLPPDYWGIEAGDVISWTSTRNGYDAKLFRVDGVTDQANLDVMVFITEVDPADYDWNQSTDFKQVAVGALVPQRVTPQPMSGWSAVASPAVNADGDAIAPGILIGATAGLDDVQSVHVQVRLAGKTAACFDGYSPYDKTAAAAEWLLSGPWCVGKTDYEIRGKYVPQSARITLWSNETLDGDGNIVEGAWLGVTTPDVSAIVNNIARQQLSDVLQSVLLDLQNAVNELRADRDRLGALVQDQDIANLADKQQLFTALQSTTGNVVADYRQQITVETSAREALATKVTALTATVGDSSSGLVSEVNANTTATDAAATAIAQLFAAQGGNDAEVNVSWAAVAAPSGYGARYAIQCAVNDGTARVATFFIDVPADSNQPTRIGVQAGQFVYFASDGTPIQAMGEDGVQESSNGAVSINWLTGAFRLTAVS